MGTSGDVPSSMLPSTGKNSWGIIIRILRLSQIQKEKKNK